MKRILFLFCINTIAFCSCQKSNEKPSGSDPWNGKNLVGKWTTVKMTISLKFDDGSVQTVTPSVKAGDFMEFAYTKTEVRTSEGTYTGQAFGLTSSGSWDLENWSGRLSFRAVDTDGGVAFAYRKVQTLDSKKLILTADDELIKEAYHINGLNGGPGKKVVGGSIYEEYSK